MPAISLSLLFSIKTTDGAARAHFKPYRFFSAIIMAGKRPHPAPKRHHHPKSMSKKANCAPAAEFLQKNDRLAGILPHASRLAAIRKACQAALPALFSTGDILQFEKGRLTVGVSSQAIAARLRQQTPFLQAALQQAGWPVESIRIKVRLKNTPWQPAPSTKKPLPDKAVNELDRLSAWLKKAGTDPALTEAVCAMLARHQQKRT